MILSEVGSKIMLVEYKDKHYFIQSKYFQILTEFFNTFKVKVSYVLLKEACETFDNIAEFVEVFSNGGKSPDVMYLAVEIKESIPDESEEDEFEVVKQVKKLSRKELNSKVEIAITNSFMDEKGVSLGLIQDLIKDQEIEHSVYYNNLRKVKKTLLGLYTDREFVKINKINFFLKKRKVSNYYRLEDYDDNSYFYRGYANDDQGNYYEDI